MSKETHFIKSANLNAEDGISTTDRWILACIVKGLQKDEDISKISLDTIEKYCKYVQENGKEKPFGKKAIQASIERLENAGKIKVIKPAKKGQCTKYKIINIEHFEKLNEKFFNLNIPPSFKGYILCALQYNLNRYKDTFEPNSMNTLTTWNVSELSKQFNMPISSIYKAEKFLKDEGILTITPDPNNKRDQETGLVIQNRSIDLNKVGLGEFVIAALENHEARLQNIENNAVTIDQVDERIKKAIGELYYKLGNK